MFDVMVQPGRSPPRTRVRKGCGDTADNQQVGGLTSEDTNTTNDAGVQTVTAGLYMDIHTSFSSKTLCAFSTKLGQHLPKLPRRHE